MMKLRKTKDLLDALEKGTILHDYRLFKNKLCIQLDCMGYIVKIGRSGDHGLMDFLILFPGAVSFQPHLVFQLLIARYDVFIDS